MRLQWEFVVSEGVSGKILTSETRFGLDEEPMEK